LLMWPTIRPHGNPPLLLCPWWREDCIPRCHSGCVYIHHERCKVSCFAKANPHSLIVFSSILSLTSQHCSIIGWYLHISWCHHCSPHLNKVDITRFFPVGWLQ
jgi:hypothetical protein